jgi:hypothetical protein
MHNQTIERHLRNANEGGPGVGVFVIPAPDLEADDAVRVVYVEDIPYRECVRRAANTLAFKWVPEGEYEIGATPSPTCGGGPCSDFTPCGGMCVCHNGYCVRAVEQVPQEDPRTPYPAT